MIRYLSPEWVTEFVRIVTSDHELQNRLEGALPAAPLGVTQLVLDGPDGDVCYHVSCTPTVITAGLGPANPENARFVQDHVTALSLATGTQNAQQAFITGHIRFEGDHQRLLDAEDLFVALDDALAPLRAVTDFGDVQR